MKANDNEFIRNRFVDLSAVNSSSTCIKKDILMNYISQLKKLRYFIDNFYYYFALLKNCKMKFDPVILTLYRWHYNNFYHFKRGKFSEMAREEN